MPDGKTHFKIWKRGWPQAIGVSAALGLSMTDPAIAAGVLAGYLLGRYIGPDLDLIGINGDEARMMEELKLLGVAIVMWYFPYAYIMRFVGLGRKGHRNFFSHFPGISTAIRLAWLLAIPAALAWWYYLIPTSYWFWTGMAGVFVGLTLADTRHALADFFQKGTKV